MNELSDDTLLNGKVRLFQPLNGFRATSDSVFLASAIKVSSGDRILDIGCGTGAASLCLVTRVNEIKVVGLEIDRELARLAQDNAALNGFEKRFEAIVGDLVKPLPRLAPHSFNHVMANPPYYEIGKVTPPEREAKVIARTEILANLVTWVDFASRMVKPGGTITFIQRASRLEEILASISKRAGKIIVYPLWSHDPFIDDSKSAKRIIVQAQIGSGAGLKLQGGLILHNTDGSFTEKAEMVLRKCYALDLTGSC